MNDPGWLSQTYPPDGAIGADGIRNQLGRPELDLLTVLVRESAQNSWDARLDDPAEPVEFSIDLSTVSPANAPAWRDLLSRGAARDPDHFPLRRTLAKTSIRLLTVSDRRTKGLGGPTRADSTGSPRDFVTFVRNVGEPRDAHLGGGTYGFGKGVFFLVSKPGSVLIYTRSWNTKGAIESRLIGTSLWKHYTSNESGREQRYTGRHWWGDVSGDIVEPLIGAVADLTAERLGITPFTSDETGTSIVVIDPDLEGRDHQEAAEYFADTVAWHLWPKMLDHERRGPTMRFRVTHDGIDVPVPDPEQTLPLKLFAAAYRAAIGADGHDLSSQRPKQHLGRLGLVKRPVPQIEPTNASRMVGIDGAVHHVCLMRPAELVVTYYEGPKPSSEHIAYAGVFRAADEMDDVYAAAEPPTHDAWHPQTLSYPQSTFVNVTFTRIRSALDELTGLSGRAASGGSGVPLGAASSFFSSLVRGARGTGGRTTALVGRRGATGGSSSQTSADVSPKRPSGLTGGGGASSGSDGAAPSDSGPVAGRIAYADDPHFEMYEGMPLVAQEFTLTATHPQRLSADLAVGISNSSGRETDPPAGGAVPAVYGWIAPDGVLCRQDSLVAEPGLGDTWRLLVTPVADTITDIAVRAEAAAT